MKFFLILLLFTCVNTSAQKVSNTYNTQIQKADKINITVNKKIGTEINNYPADAKHQLYFVNWRDLTNWKDTLSNDDITEMTFESIDSSTVRNVNIVAEFSTPFDTAFVSIIGLPHENFNPFNKNAVVRDVYKKISSDRKTFQFLASYIASTISIKLFVIRKKGSGGMNIKLNGVGKLF